MVSQSLVLLHSNYVMGINSVYHESSACILKDGKLLTFVEEERLNRKKHAKKALIDNPHILPKLSIQHCLDTLSSIENKPITFKDIHSIGFSFNPQKRLDWHKNYTNYNYTLRPNNFGTVEGEQLFYDKLNLVENQFRDLGFLGDFHFIDHHDCHAGSSFFVSPFKNAAVLVVDGIGEYESTTLYHGVDNKMIKIGSIDYPNSIGFLWEKFSEFLGFSEYDACKAMGLAAYGDPSIFKEEFNKICEINDDDNKNFFKIDDNIMRFRSVDDFSEMEKLLKLKKLNEPIRNVDEKTQLYSSVSAALQETTENVLIKLLNFLKKETQENNLVIAGGVSLNCAANGKIAEKKIFDDIYIQPASHDGGTSIGAAYYIWNQIENNPRSFYQEIPYLGKSYIEDIEKVFDKYNIKYVKSIQPEVDAANLINEGNVIAWHQDKFEAGPRALGNRSILADPRIKEVRELINHKVKFREPFRPFCPSVLEEEAENWFQNDFTSASKYMLVAHKIKNQNLRKIIPAVVHEDGTCRLQLVSKKINPKYHKLIHEFYKKSGIPIVLNTSFNVQEPIISSVEEALSTFLKSEIDYLVIDKYIVKRKDNEGIIINKE